MYIFREGGGATKSDEFPEKVPKGGGSFSIIFNPKIYNADFGPLDRVICAEIEKL